MAYLGNSPLNRLYSTQPITLGQGQTVVNVSYTPGLCLVFKNGALLDPETDYTATDGSTITLANAANAGDLLRVINLSQFAVANALALSGGEVTGPVTYSGPQRTTLVTDNDLSFDLSAGGNDYLCTLAATGVLTFTNIADNAGKSGHIKIVNGANYTVGAAATTKIKAPSLAAISTTGTYLLGYWCDGINVYITASSNLS